MMGRREKRIGYFVRSRPSQNMSSWAGRVFEETAYAAHSMMYACEVISNMLRFEDVVSILTIRKIVVGEVRPGQVDLIIDAVQLHMLEPPAFIDALGDEDLTESYDIWSVIHANFASFREVLGQRC